jgi:hypothetical protein
MNTNLSDSDPWIANVRQRFEKSHLSLDELGTRMGYPEDSARKSAWKFLNETSDPRLSVLRRFAVAVNCSVKSLV